jgi:drug/metabolite transporter (DMT)-like permease
MRDRHVGMAYALASTVFAALVVLISKRSLNTLDPLTHSAFVFVSGSACFVVYFAVRRDHAAFRPTAVALRRAAVLGLLDALMFVLYMAGIQQLDAGTASLVQQSWHIFTIVASVVFLRERFTRGGALGLVIGILGAGLLSYTTSPVARGGMVAIIAAGVAVAAGYVFARRWASSHRPVHMAFHRCVWVMLFLLAATALYGSAGLPGRDELLAVGVIGFVGPFLNIIAFYMALARIEAARVAMTRPLTTLIVLVVGYVVFHQVPAAHQLVGGLVLIAGLLILNASAQPASRLTRTASGASSG